MVDMRSPTPGPLTDIRRKIEPQFEKALTAENTKYSLKNTDKNAVKMELVWFGDRPAYKRTDYDDAADMLSGNGAFPGTVLPKGSASRA